MPRHLAKATIVVLLCSCLFLLVACGDDLEGSVWRGKNAAGVQMQLEFLPDSECRMSFIEDGAITEQATVGWRLDGDQVSIDFDDGTIVFTLDGNIMTTGGGDSVQTLYRQTEAIAGSPIPQGAAAELGSPDLPTANASGVGVDLSGSYRELVQRAHDLYDEGDRLFAAEEIEQGVAYFAAAAQVYEAAWKKEPGDPNVGTDWATSLFYSGDFDGAIERVRIVLEENPDFQAGWFNLGNYLTHQARMAESGDDQVETARLYGEASEAYSKAAAIDPESDTGIEAAARAAELAQ